MPVPRLVPAGDASLRRSLMPGTHGQDLIDRGLAAVVLFPGTGDLLLTSQGERAAGALGRPGDGTSASRRQRLAQPQVVAAGVADGGVADAVGLVNRLLEDLRPARAQRLEGLVQVVDLDEDR